MRETFLLFQQTLKQVTEAFMRLLKEVVLLNKNDFGKTKVENIANLNNQTSVEPQKKTFCY